MPLGGSERPTPVGLLAASVANCLAACLIFAIRKYNGDPGEVVAKVQGKLARHNKYWRVDSISVTIELTNSIDKMPHIAHFR